MNKYFLGVLVLLVLGGAYYLFTAYQVKELDEPLIFNDMFDKMDADEMKAFQTAVEESGLEVKEMSEQMPEVSEIKILAQGDFMPRAHDVVGVAKVIEGGGQNILRFEDFETINGPNLHIYLSSDLGGDDYIDLGEIRATKGNVNYELPDGVDLKKYNKVLVWCVPFRVLFSFAELR